MGTRPSLRAPGPGVAQGKNQANGRRLGNGSIDPREVDKCRLSQALGGKGTEEACEQSGGPLRINRHLFADLLRGW